MQTKITSKKQNNTRVWEAIYLTPDSLKWGCRLEDQESEMATRVSEWRLATIDAGGECLTTVSRWWWLDRCCGMSFRTTGCHRHPSPPPNSGSATSSFIQQHQSTSLHVLLHLFSIFFSAQWHEIVPDYQGERKERWNGEQ
ncbi:hypothetical protein L1887_03680 [Cichorium endivia]|nr:hypothetical protein L1887_03680 [Cichorium endivia]